MGPSLSSTLQPGQAFGRYQIVRTIGVGSFGIVYEAVQYPLGRRVALKLLHDRTLTHPDALARFEREAMAAARLRHPHSVEVVDYGAHEGVAFLAMELLEGESLQALMRRAGPLPTEFPPKRISA
jgi:serine/threonine-protein kinase